MLLGVFAVELKGSCLLGVNAHEGVEVGARRLRDDLARLEPGKLEQETQTDEFGSSLTNELDHRDRRSTRRDQIVDDEHLVLGDNRILVRS